MHVNKSRMKIVNDGQKYAKHGECGMLTVSASAKVFFFNPEPRGRKINEKEKARPYG